MMLMSKRMTGGPVTTTERAPQSPYPLVVSMQSGPFAGAKYRPVGVPALYPVALMLNALIVLSMTSCGSM